MGNIINNLQYIADDVSNVYEAGIRDGKSQSINREQEVAQTWVWPNSEEDLEQWVEEYGYLYQTGNSVLDAFKDSIEYIETDIYEDKVNLKQTLEWIKGITDSTKNTVDTFFQGEGIEETLDTLIEIQTKLKELVEMDSTLDGIIDEHTTNKANKVVNATENHFAGLSRDGDLIDSGKNADDFATADHNHDNVYKRLQNAVTETGDVDKTLKISQNAQGVITAEAVDIAIDHEQVTDFDTAVQDIANGMDFANNDTVNAIAGRVDTLETNSATKAELENKPGSKVEIDGTARGEVFNITNTNFNHAISNWSQASGKSTSAGSYVFNITGIEAPAGATTIQFTLDAVTTPAELRLAQISDEKEYKLMVPYTNDKGKEVKGDEVSWDISDGIGNHEAKGTIDTIEGTKVTVKLYSAIGAEIILPTGEEDYAYFKVLNKPFCGTTVYGTAAHAEGYQTKANAVGAHAEGYTTIAGGKYSHAEGYGTLAGYCAHAEGMGTKAINQRAHAEGESTLANAYNAHAEGMKTEASGKQAHAEGENNKALVDNSHAEGSGNKVSGISGHAEGQINTVTGEAAHAENRGNYAHGNYSHAGGLYSVINENAEGAFVHGQYCYASYPYTTAFGKCNQPGEQYLFMIGNGVDNNNRKNAFTVNTDGTATVQTNPKNDMDVATKNYVDTQINNALSSMTLISPNGTRYLLSVDDNGELYLNKEV